MLVIEKNLKRIVFIDELRGLCIILMVIYHYLYNIFELNNITILNNSFLIFTRNFFAGVFILISGISCNFSKNNISRGIKCFLIGLLITLITYFFFPSQLIIFGILHMLGCSMVLYGLFENSLKKINCKFLMVLFVVLFIISFNVQNGFVGLLNLFTFSIPSNLYNNNILFSFGIINKKFFSADYFPLFPWVFLFMFGGILGGLKKPNKFPLFMYKTRFKILSLCGKKTLAIYILHQPIFYMFFYIFTFLNNI